MFGKKFSEYVRFDSWILILVALVFVVRLVLPMAGVQISQARWVSINVVLLVGLLFCSVAVHVTRFGSYKQLLGLLFVQNAFAHILIACGIMLGIVTGKANIYTAPEFFGGSNGATWSHVLAHILGAILVPVIVWLFGSVILFVTKKVTPA
jgi:hypothetical protein